MGPPWRIDPTTHCTMNECSYHGATSRSPFFLCPTVKNYMLSITKTISCEDGWIKQVGVIQNYSLAQFSNILKLMTYLVHFLISYITIRKSFIRLKTVWLMNRASSRPYTTWLLKCMCAIPIHVFHFIHSFYSFYFCIYICFVYLLVGWLLYLFIFLFIYLFNNLFNNLFIYLSIYLFIFLFIKVLNTLLLIIDGDDIHMFSLIRTELTLLTQHQDANTTGISCPLRVCTLKNVIII